ARLLRFQRDLGVEPPIALFVTLLGVADLEIRGLDQQLPQWGGPPVIDRNVVPLPEVVIDSFDSYVGRLLRPLFDGFWQSGGLPRSPHYDGNGVWQRRDG